MANIPDNLLKAIKDFLDRASVIGFNPQEASKLNNEINKIDSSTTPETIKFKFKVICSWKILPIIIFDNFEDAIKYCNNHSDSFYKILAERASSW